MSENIEFKDYSNQSLVQAYGILLSEMRERGIIRSKNVTGDLGEFIAIDYYTKTAGLPKLQLAPPSTKNIDAISVNGERYTIKTITTNTTGTFYGIPKEVKKEDIKPVFEYLIIVKLDDNYLPVFILEMDWDTFFKHKHWHSRINAYNVIVNKDVINDSKIIFQKSNK